uniref:WGS project CAEQ00000000 data, annotated contig 16 n=1 Tax=Trypanosoma congolense (strain IL3000) TaxID=1068625 RepID=F9W7G9_TRYCI|nr:unnamed protein product [Trypanosoma congolense IL3000]
MAGAPKGGSLLEFANKARDALSDVLSGLGPEGTRRSAPADLPSSTVFLNVYDIVRSNNVLYYVGMGVHHTGVEVYGMEFAFGRCAGDTGVVQVEPKNTPPHTFREQLVLGTTKLTRGEVVALLQEFKGNREQWSGYSYHLVRNNCNHFSGAFAKRLLPPDVRFETYQEMMMGNGSNDVVEIYDNGERETVQLSNGNSVTVPVLMPSWVNRLASSAEGILGSKLVDSLDDMDKRAQVS